MNTKEYIHSQIAEAMAAKQKFQEDTALLDQICKAAEQFVSCFENGGRVLAAGNGGSAADAQHFVAELVSRFFSERPPLPAMTLTTDPSVMSALANDYGYDEVFARQMKVNSAKGDVFFGISTSGNSENLIKAMRVGRERGVFTIGMTGESGGKIKDECDLLINVPSDQTQRIQEMHNLTCHLLCAYIETKIYRS